MDAAEFLTNVARLCTDNACTDECPLRFFCTTGYYDQTKQTIDTAMKVVKSWAEDHPLKTRLSEYKKMFPDARLRSDGYPSADPCNISKLYDDGKCAEMKDCNKCREEYWNGVVE